MLTAIHICSFTCPLPQAMMAAEKLLVPFSRHEEPPPGADGMLILFHEYSHMRCVRAAALARRRGLPCLELDMARRSAEAGARLALDWAERQGVRRLFVLGPQPDSPLSFKTLADHAIETFLHLSNVSRKPAENCAPQPSGTGRAE